MNLKSLSLAGAIATGLLCSTAAFAADVASGATVSYTGSGFGGSSSQWGAGVFDPAAITGATLLPDGTQWNLGTTFWNGTAGGDPSQWLTISLGQMSTISSIVLQADNNDAYQVLYHNGSGWTALGTFSDVGGWGLNTRPELTFSSITTDAFQIVATGGDGYYSVGHFTANGVPAVPEPETYGMMMAGLGLIGFMARRRTHTTT